MQESVAKPAIYISYAWNSESDAIAEAIEKEFSKKGVRIIRDKNDLKYKDRLRDFMKAIGRGKYVILIVSPRYLKSENCMYELLQIFKNQDFYERIFPIVLEDVKISKAADRIELVKYWENEADNLDSKIRELKKLSNIQGVTDDLNHYSEIRNNIAILTNILKDINYLNRERHISSNFKELYELIQAKIENELNVENDNSKTDDNTIAPKTSVKSKSDYDNQDRSDEKKRGKKVLYGFVGLLTIVLLVQFVSETSFLKKEQSTDKPAEEAHVEVESPLIMDEKDSLAIETEEPLQEEKSPPPSNTKYNVTLVVPSSLAGEDVYIDNKQAEVIDRGLNTITVRLTKKSSSHHFEIKKGSQKCVTDKLIDKDSIRFAMLCN